ncbi:glycosyltransferase family 25 protein [Acidisoma sp. S159]|jgi:glycosyl transferase family 25|uniref:glycosyltransferase family 25 protein n=1 Tax=Acidisoma sp. S159 TaxID=1747225 RepID=UPI00131DC958|nr:glycosyltransferase family 25 protein [Acidisoma sp. S159]
MGEQGEVSAIGDAWVINLSDRPDRLQRFQTENARSIVARRFEAIGPADVTRKALLDDGMIGAENTYTLPALCCARSHLTLWRRSAETNRSITIFEDDAILHRRFAEIAARVAATVQGWDIILWGWNHSDPITIDLGGGLSPARLGFVRDDVFEGFSCARESAVEPRLIPLHVACGILGYTLSPGGAARLLARSLPLGNAHAPSPKEGFEGWRNDGIDVEMARHYGALRAYACVPPIAYNVYSRSSINQNWVD